GIPWQALYVSPMRRTLATLRPLAEKTGLEIGKSTTASGRAKPTPRPAKPIPKPTGAGGPSRPGTPPGGETAVQIANRALPVVAEISSLRILLRSLLGIHLGRYRDRIEVLAASVSVVKFDRYGPLLESLGERGYLAPNLQQRVGT
ncbi:histidine phosphatase family protein, partial [Synechococcus sp. H60.3]